MGDIKIYYLKVLIISFTFKRVFRLFSFKAAAMMTMTTTMMAVVMAVMRQAESATQKLLFSVWLAAVLSSAWVWFLQSGVPLAGNQESVHFTEKQTQTEGSFIRAEVEISLPFVLERQVLYPSAAQEAT